LYEALGYFIDIPNCHYVNGCAQCQCYAVTTSVQSAPGQKFREAFGELFQPPETIAGYLHKPKVDPAVRPRAQPLRRVPSALRTDVNKELSRMVKEGILEWVSSVVVVKKQAGIRICCNLSAVNDAIVPGSYPLPTINELGSSLAGFKVFSKIDLRWGYLQVVLDTESRV
jgi:hypothetical protein